MLKVLRSVLPSPEQWDIIIEGMRNPMNSWGKSDSYMTYVEDPDVMLQHPFEHFMGENDISLANNLAIGGGPHAKFRRMIPVFVTIEAPLYFWKEFDTYKVGTVCNSCSTMHKIHARKFTIDDFAHEHLIDYELYNELEDEGIVLNDEPNVYCGGVQMLNLTVNVLNFYRKKFLETNDKRYWWQMIQLLPSSYNQRRTVMLNYETLSQIYFWRRDHKLDEWRTLCDWIETSPYFEEIIDAKPSSKEE